MYKLCKTEQSAARQRELELALADMMMQQRYEEISVSEFCSHAGIPRKAFYRYFSSKDGALYALIDHTIMEMEALRDLGRKKQDDRVLPKLERFFRFWESQKSLLDAFRMSGITGILLERTIGAVSQSAAVKRISGCDNEFTQTQIIRFAVSGIMIMMINWHRDGYRESPREMAELTARIIDQPLLPYLKEL